MVDQYIVVTLNPTYYQLKKVYCGSLKNKELLKYEELAITSVLSVSDVSCLSAGLTSLLVYL
jgi:hypothetical protein